MEPTRRNVFTTYTILGLAASVMMGWSYLGAEIYCRVDEWLVNQEAGVLRWLSWLFRCPWTDILVQYVFILGVGYLLMGLIACLVPKDPRKQEKLSGEDFLVCLTASMGIGFLLNMVGTEINYVISQFTGKNYLDMNPVTDMVMDLSPSMIMYSCILGPFMEEVLFRGIFLKRARLYGDRTAVVFTAIMFGLMHGNLSQFLYAAAIGLFFGYVAVKSNGIRYTVLLHMIVNSYGTIIVLGEEVISRVDPLILPIFYTIGTFVTMMVLIVGGIIAVVKYAPVWYRQLTWNNGLASPNKKYVYLNPGFLIYLAVCLMEVVGYMV